MFMFISLVLTCLLVPLLLDTVAGYIKLIVFVLSFIWIIVSLVIMTRDDDDKGLEDDFYLAMTLFAIWVLPALLCVFLLKFSGFYVWNKMTIDKWKTEGKTILLTETLDESIFYSRRRNAANALLVAPDIKSVEPFIKALKTKDYSLLMTAIAALGKLKDTRSVESLITIMMNNSNLSVRRLAAESLGKIGMWSLNEEEKINYLLLAGDTNEKIDFLRNKDIHVTINMTDRLREDLKYNTIEPKLIDLSLLSILSGTNDTSITSIVLKLDGWKTGASYGTVDKSVYLNTGATLSGNISLGGYYNNSIIAQEDFSFEAELPPKKITTYKKSGAYTYRRNQAEIDRKLFDNPSYMALKTCMKLFKDVYKTDFLTKLLKFHTLDELEHGSSLEQYLK